MSTAGCIDEGRYEDLTAVSRPLPACRDFMTGCILHKQLFIVSGCLQEENGDGDLPGRFKAAANGQPTCWQDDFREKIARSDRSGHGAAGRWEALARQAAALMKNGLGQLAGRGRTSLKPGQIAVFVNDLQSSWWKIPGWGSGHRPRRVPDGFMARRPPYSPDNRMASTWEPNWCKG